MSEEQRNEETEVEAHGQRTSGQRVSANDEPGDEVEAHGQRTSGQRVSANDEPEDEVEGHVSKASHPKYS
ncbi:MAG TPA: hypothetical protein VGM45_00045 [Gaiellaceae bacterium]|jgi:hypothetical protein